MSPNDPITAWPKRKVNIVNFKRYMTEKIPINSKLKGIILAERDELEVEVFLAKMDVWLKLLALESS